MKSATVNTTIADRLSRQTNLYPSIWGTAFRGKGKLELKIIFLGPLSQLLPLLNQIRSYNKVINHTSLVDVVNLHLQHGLD